MKNKNIKSDKPSKARDPKLVMSLGEIINNSEELKKAFNIKDKKNDLRNMRNESKKTKK